MTAPSSYSEIWESFFGLLQEVTKWTEEECEAQQEDFISRGGKSQQVISPRHIHEALRELEEFREFKKDGSLAGPHVILAIRICAAHGIPIPIWLAGEFINRIQHFIDWKADTLDEAFGFPQRSRKHQASYLRRAKLAPIAYNAVKAWRREKPHPNPKWKGKRPPPIDPLLFEEVAESIGETMYATREAYLFAKKVLVPRGGKTVVVTKNHSGKKAK